MKKKLNFNKIHFSLSKDLIIPQHRQGTAGRLSKHQLESCEDLTNLCGFVVDEFELPIYFQWTSDDVQRWIKDLGFPQYQKTFKVNFVNGRTLLLVDAAALIKMNIKNFDHIQTITKEIRRLYNFDLGKFNRSISLPLQNPETSYKFYKIPTGPIHELCSFTDFLKKMKLMKEEKIQLNHFEKLHQFLKHIPGFQNTKVGGIKRINLYFVKPNTYRDVETLIQATCVCTFGICECNWSENEKRKPWRMGFLVQIDEGKYQRNICEKLEIDLLLMK